MSQIFIDLKLISILYNALCFSASSTQLRKNRNRFEVENFREHFIINRFLNITATSNDDHDELSSYSDDEEEEI